jgi:hypothetical protein
LTVTYVFTTDQFSEYRTFEELLADTRRFEQVVGRCFLDIVWGETPATCEEPDWVQDWAVRLDEGDCRALCGELPAEVEELRYDDLEVEYDTPVAHGTHGSRRPQAVRQARARRAAFLRSF